MLVVYKKSIVRQFLTSRVRPGYPEGYWTGPQKANFARGHLGKAFGPWPPSTWVGGTKTGLFRAPASLFCVLRPFLVLADAPEKH